MSSQISPDSGYTGKLLIGALAGCATAIYTVFHFAAPYYSTILEWNLRQSAFFWVTLVVLAVVAAVLAMVLTASESGRPSGEPTGTAVSGSVAVALVCLVVAGFYVFSYHDYQQAQRYLPGVEVVDAPVPELAQRVPFQVATAQTRSNLGGTVGDVTQTAYLPGTDRYGSLVERVGWLQGYQVVLEQDFELTGRGQPSTCEFAPDGARLNGWLSHNLGRLIAQEQRGVRFSYDDAYGFCREGTPFVVVPLKEQDGFLTVTERFAGVAIYNGLSQELTITRDTRELPGPSYPLSLAASQREATHGLGGYADWFFGRVGWELTETSDINSSGAAEYVLASAGATTDEQYVTPLTARHGATAISAISTLGVGDVEAGLATLRVHPLGAVWRDPAAIEDAIRSDFADLANWQQFQLFELAPLDGDRWVASFGRAQNIIYRVQGHGTLSAPSCLYAADGTKIRCGASGSTLTPVEPGEGLPAAPAAPSGALTGLSDAELGELARRVAEETSRRLGGS